MIELQDEVLNVKKITRQLKTNFDSCEKKATAHTT